MIKIIIKTTHNYRNVNVCIQGGKEHYLILNRAFWLIILSALIGFQTIVIDPMFYTVSDISKWGLMCTWLTFCFGLFATTP